MRAVTWREIIRDFIPSSPLVRHLGIELKTLEPDRAELLLPYRPELATMGDVVHGGAIATLIDTTAMAAAWAHDEEAPESATGSTLYNKLTTRSLNPLSPKMTLSLPLDATFSRTSSSRSRITTGPVSRKS